MQTMKRLSALLVSALACLAGSVAPGSDMRVTQLWLSNQGQEYRHTFLYNSQGNVQLETRYVQAADGTWQREAQTEWFYDGGLCVGQMRRVFDQGAWRNVDEVESVYNRVDDLTDEYTYQYDANGARAATKHVKLSYPDGGLHREEYDYSGGAERLRLRQVAAYDGDRVSSRSTEVYDEAGRLSATFRTTYAYDGSGRLAGCRVDSASVPQDSVRWFYDEAGRVVSQRLQTWNDRETDWENAQLTDYEYTADGAVQSETHMHWGGMAWENVCRYAYTYDGGLRTRQALQTQLYREWRDLASVHYTDFADGQACTITSEYEFWGGDAGTPARSHIPFLFNGELVIREAESIRLEYDHISTVEGWTADEQPVRVYPNPSDGVFYLSTEWHDILSWQVYDLKGQLVNSHTPHYPTGVIDLTGLERGVYILRVQTTAGHQQQKLIKE